MDEAPGRDVRRTQVPRQAAQAGATNHESVNQERIVDAKARVEFEPLLLAAEASEGPGPRPPVDARHLDGLVRLNLLQRKRTAAACEIRGSGAKVASYRPQPDRDKLRVGHRSHAHGDVDVVDDQVHGSTGQLQ